MTDNEQVAAHLKVCIQEMGRVIAGAEELRREHPNLGPFDLEGIRVARHQFIKTLAGVENERHGE